MARFPSLDEVGQAAQDAFRRFPLALLCGIGTALLLWFENHFPWKYSSHATFVANASLSLSLGLVLSLGMQLFAEARKATGARERFWEFCQWLALPVAVFCFLVLEARAVTRVYFQYGQFSLAFHLFVAVAPFLSRDRRDIDAFWEFNRSLFVRFLQATVFSGTLYLGLAAACGAIDLLFDKVFSEKIYLDLFIGVSFVFHPWFFLVGVPRKTESSFEYPRILRNFLQFLLIPLVCLYLAILGAYLLKIVFKFELPKGWVSYLVSAASSFGILSVLLGYPLWSRRDPKWMETFARAFYWALLPLLGLMAAGLVTRVGDYGWTESRYFLFLLNLWLLGIVVYYGILGRSDIRRIPQSLFLLCFITAWGPWGAASVSLRSQLENFERLMTKAGLLKDGLVRKAAPAAKFDFEIRRQLSSVVDYLIDRHGYATLEAFLPESLQQEFEASVPQTGYYAYGRRGERIRSHDFTLKFFSYINMAYVTSWEQKRGNGQQSAAEAETFKITVVDTINNFLAIDIKGYDFYIAHLGHGTAYEFPDSKLRLRTESLEGGGTRLIVDRGDRRLAELPIQNWIEKLLGPEMEALGRQSYSVAADQALFVFEDGTLRVKVRIQHANGRRLANGGFKLEWFSAQLLLDEK